jgi:acetyl esterase/lipase
VIYIHGGGWANGIPRTAAVFANWPDVLASFAARGYVTASVSYRFQNEAPFPAAIQDVKAAIRWLHSNAEKYNIDITRGMTWGSSAGGQLAALAAVSCGVAALDPPVTAAGAAPANANVEKNTAGPLEAAASNCVQGAVGWYGVYDFETLGKGVAPGSPPLNLPSRYLDCGSEPCTAEMLRFASPVTYVDEKAPPILLIQGTDDHTVSPAQSPEFYEALRAKGAKVELMMLPGIDHSYIGATPEATREAALTGLAKTIEFIDATIGDKR